MLPYEVVERIALTNESLWQKCLLSMCLLNSVHLAEKKFCKVETFTRRYDGHVKTYTNIKLCGFFHSVDGRPAKVISTKTYTEKFWFNFGVLHRNKKYAYKKYGIEGVEKRWYLNGVLKRNNDKPTIVKKFKQIKESSWCYSKKRSDKVFIPFYKQITTSPFLFHRVNGPAFIRTGKDKTISLWFVEGLLSNNKGPAVNVNSSKVTLTEWFLNGKLHRVNGPAVIKGLDKMYYIKGVRIVKTSRGCCVFECKTKGRCHIYNVRVCYRHKRYLS